MAIVVEEEVVPVGRVRVVLSEKKLGLKRCWISLKPDLQTISHFSDYLTRLLHLPNQITLSIDGFVLPSFEPISILKDNDLISVKFKRNRISDHLLETALPQNATHVSKKRKPSSTTTKSRKKHKTTTPDVVEIDSSKRRLDKVAKEADVVHLPNDEIIKLPSRSARRKKAKRRWLREISKVEKKETNQHETPEKENQQAPSMDNRQSPKKKKTESSQKDTIQITKEGTRISTVQQSQSSDVNDEVFPIVVRPGHIRFEPLENDSSVQQNQTPVETYKWNGITSKKKGQKWGMEKATCGGRSNNNDFTQEVFETLYTEEEVPIYPVDFDFSKLAPYASLPEKGDVIAYRLIQLSSSWCPEVSSFRAGRISQYDPKTNKVSVEQVPEYPVVFEKTLDEEGEEVSTPQLDTSLYNENGSLEIEFSSLIDVRIVKHGNLDASNAVKQSTVNGGIRTSQDSTANGTSKEKKDATPPVMENGDANMWDEISEVLSAKKAQLSQEEGWQERENTRRKSWSSKSLRGSALGPTMAILRAENKI